MNKRFLIPLSVLLLAAIVAGQALAAGGYQAAIRVSDNLIVAIGNSLAPQSGQNICTPDSSSAGAIATAIAGPNGGVTWSGYTGPDPDGNCTGGTVAAQPTPTPTPIPQSGLAAGAAAGTGAPSPAIVAGSTHLRGAIRFGTGTGPSAGTMISVTFPQALASSPVVLLTATNAATAGLQLYSVPTATGATIGANVAPAAGQALGTYIVQYEVVS